MQKNKISSEKEILITKQVKIVHPTDFILLPRYKDMAEDGSPINGDQWQMQATGGTGFFNWFVKDNSVASIKGSGVLTSEEVGKTIVKVFDTHNQKNFDTIEVIVEPVGHIEWLEAHMEVKAGD